MGNLRDKYTDDEWESLTRKKEKPKNLTDTKGVKEQLSKLEDFQKAFKSTYNDKPSFISPQDYELRFKLLREENEEYLEACQNNDMIEIADALGDSLYIVLGSIVSHGMQNIIDDVFSEIHRSNMSKLDENSEPIINGQNGKMDNTRPIGKILKSENYFEPNLKQFLND
jgi:predicted HAD superfamily Cof-like phosphohydrolase